MKGVALLMKMLPAAIVLACCQWSVAGAAALTPMEPGFRQMLDCNGGSVVIAVGTKPDPLAPEATVVSTTLTLGAAKIVTNALRSMDASGNIYALGYALPGFVRRFRKTRLLPASPPAPPDAAPVNGAPSAFSRSLHLVATA